METTLYFLGRSFTIKAKDLAILDCCPSYDFRIYHTSGCQPDPLCII